MHLTAYSSEIDNNDWLTLNAHYIMYIIHVGGRNGGVQGQSPWLEGKRGSPPEAEKRSLVRCPKDGEIWPIVKDFSLVLKLVQQSKCFFSIGRAYPDLEIGLTI